MALTKPPVLPVWADTGDKVQPSDVEIAEGWPLTNVPPSRQRFNWLENFLFNGVRYFSRRGLPDWDATETYEIGDSVIGPDNQLYRSITSGNLNQTPASNPSDWGVWLSSLAAVPGRLIGTQTINSTQVYTPTSGTNSVIVECVGGGGAGGGAAAQAAGQTNAGGGGGSGSFAKVRFTSGFAGVIATIGAGGTGSSVGPGNNGGASSFGGLISCPGGLGGILAPSNGLFANTVDGAAGGGLSSIIGGSTLARAAGVKGERAVVTAANFGGAGEGGGSFYGGKASAGSGGEGVIVNASGPAAPGVAGTAGVIVVLEYS